MPSPGAPHDHRRAVFATARTIFRRYFGPDASASDRRFDDVFTGELGLVRIVPETVVIRDPWYTPTAFAQT